MKPKRTTWLTPLTKKESDLAIEGRIVYRDGGSTIDSIPPRDLAKKTRNLLGVDLSKDPVSIFDNAIPPRLEPTLEEGLKKPWGFDRWRHVNTETGRKLFESGPDGEVVNLENKPGVKTIWRHSHVQKKTYRRKS